jgi:hypothetical protein
MAPLLCRALLGSALLAGACGGVTPPADVDGSVTTDAPGGSAVPYRGHVDALAPVPFGMMPASCDYTMTFKQLDVVIGLDGTTPRSGRVQNLNVEAVIGSCPYPPAPDVISIYTFESVKAGAGGMELTFQADPTNRTVASLIVLLVKSATGYTAKMTFHRTDLASPFDWTVKADVAVAP